MILNVHELRFLYRNHDVLKKIAFDVNHEESVAILGPMGWKNNTLKCLK
jgi:ABC-type phosphate/phosphonate transport system ATPase subunit